MSSTPSVFLHRGSLVFSVMRHPPPCTTRPAPPSVRDGNMPLLVHRPLAAALDAAPRAMLESHSGPHAAGVLTPLPTSPELRLQPPAFRVLLLRRLQLPMLPHNVLLRDVNVQVQRPDERRIEVIAKSLPLWGAARCGYLRVARQAKERTYPEFLQAPRCRLVVLALELGGHWG